MTAVAPTTTTWRLDPAASTAAFRCRGLGGLPVRGTVALVEGGVTTDAAGRVVEVSGTVDATSVATGNRRRDADLRAPRLLGTAAVPRWDYRATSVVADGDGWRVEGVLTAVRATPLALDVARVEDLADGGVRLRATGRLDRAEAGVRAPRALVWREVRVALDVVLRPAAPGLSQRADGRSAP